MDYSPIVAQVWGILTWFIPAPLLIGLLKSPWAKGLIGEPLVRLFAHWQLEKQTYRRLHNVTLSTPDGTTQIDHVVLSRYGIFVLETKNMSGWIFGSEKQAQWTQKLYKRTFTAAAELQAPQSRRSHPWRQPRASALGHHLCRRQHLQNRSARQRHPGHRIIRYIQSFPQQVFSEAKVNATLHALQTGRHAPTLATHREHVQNLKRRSNPTAERQCPKCGSALLIRKVNAGPKAGQRFGGVFGVSEVQDDAKFLRGGVGR